MSSELLVKHCSPTLAGLKTGNMFTCPYESERELREFLRFWNQALSGKGLRVLCLRCRQQRALIYLYRPSWLQKDLQDQRASHLLLDRGYSMHSPTGCLVQLMKRLEECEEFPHEIGLFLGYPPEDVVGFIDNTGKCKCTGYWKVYGNEEEAKKTFARYKKCTDEFSGRHARGVSIQRLTVAG